MKTQPTTKPPDKIIDDGILVLAALLGVYVQLILKPWCQAPADTPFFGMIIGLAVGTIVRRIRPTHDTATGAWSRFNSFFLEQMNWEDAFRRRKQ